MRKQDDDLKIDLGELFGGDLSIPPQPSPKEGALPSAPAGPSQDDQFQEWMIAREGVLEAKAQELERRIQETGLGPLPQGPDDRIEPLEQPVPEPEPPAPVVAEAVPEAVEPAVPEPTAAVDFNAPMTPPFMGANPLPPPSPAAEGTTLKGPSEPVDDQALMERLKNQHEFMMLFDEFRNIVIFELKDLVGERKTFTMLSRTVELARERHPDVLKKANWDKEGNLLEDGSVDPQRVIDNLSSLDPSKAETALDAALGSLLKLRMQAIEKGLGAGMKNKVRARMYQWISEKGKKAPAGSRQAADFQRLSGYVMGT